LFYKRENERKVKKFFHSSWLAINKIKERKYVYRRPEIPSSIRKLM